jgi:hypothetical protein
MFQLHCTASNVITSVYVCTYNTIRKHKEKLQTNPKSQKKERKEERVLIQGPPSAMNLKDPTGA